MATPPDFSSGAVLTAAQMNSVGLWLVKTQVVGNAVASVAVTSAFSSDYDSYRIIYSGGSQSIAGEMRMTLGATAANYYSAILYSTWAGAVGATGGAGGVTMEGAVGASERLRSMASISRVEARMRGDSNPPKRV